MGRWPLATAAAGGLSWFASLPPRGWWLFGVLGVALAVRALRGTELLKRLLAGSVMGLSLFLPGLFWAADFSLPGYLVLASLEAAFLTVAAGVTPPTTGRRLGFAAAFVAAEAFRWHWPLGGLPLASPIHGQVDGPLLSSASLGGPLLVLALVAGFGVSLEAWLERGQWRILGGVSAAAVVMSSVGGALPHTSAQRPVRVAAVQGGGPRGVPAIVSDEREVFGRHLEVTRWIDRRADLVLWPEGAVAVSGSVAASTEEAQLADAARTSSATLVAGVVERVEGRRFRNAAVAWGPNGSITDRYEKVHRVPFGEYVPARRLFERLADLSLVPRDAIAGEGPGVLATPVGRLGVLISFEVFFPNRARSAVEGGGRLLLVPTNAASYVGPQVPSEEVAAARLRAVETGRALVQAAPTGYSAIVDAQGRVTAISDLGSPDLLAADVDLRQGITPYIRLGDLPLLLSAVAGLAASWFLRRRSERGLGAEPVATSAERARRRA